MKRYLALAALIVLSVAQADDLIIPAPAGSPLTMTGSAIRLVPNPSTANPVMCASLFIEPLSGGSNPVYVLNAAPNVTMAYNGAGTTTVAQLAAATSTLPGQSFTFPSNGPSNTQTGGVDLRYFGLYGTASDTVLAVCTVKQ